MAKTSNPPTHPMHTSFFPTPKRQGRQQTGEIRSLPDKGASVVETEEEERSEMEERKVWRTGEIRKDRGENRWR